MKLAAMSKKKSVKMADTRGVRGIETLQGIDRKCIS